MPDTAGRILDAAEELLITFGYRKVTMDEVATMAGVGRGTVYLYWPAKRELFAAVLARDITRRLAEQLDDLTADPGEVRLHRAMRRVFLQTMRRPLARALATADHRMLGEVLTMTTAGADVVAGKVDTMATHLAVLHKHGMLADDPAADPAVLYRLASTVLGAFVLEGTGGVPGIQLDLEQKADALATTVRRAFEPEAEPHAKTVRHAAGELTGLYQEWLADLNRSLPHQADPGA